MKKNVYKVIIIAIISSMAVVCPVSAMTEEEVESETTEETKDLNDMTIEELKIAYLELQLENENLKNELSSTQQLLEEYTQTGSSDAENESEDNESFPTDGLGNFIAVKDTELVQEQWAKSSNYGCSYPGWEIDILSEIYSDNAAKYQANFIDQTFSVSGVIYTVKEDYIGLTSREYYGKQISFSNNEMHQCIWAYLPTEDLINLSEGDTITVMGKFSKYEDDGDSFLSPVAVIYDAQIVREEATASVGDTIITDNFEVTLNSAEFVSYIDLDIGRETFGLPISSDEKEYSELYMHSSDCGVLSINYTYKFIGEDPIEFYPQMTVPIIYGEYFCLTSEAILFDNYDGDWSLAGTSMTRDYLQQIHLDSFRNKSRNFDSTKGMNEIEGRGYMLIPEEIEKNDQQLTLYLTGLDVSFIIR